MADRRAKAAADAPMIDLIFPNREPARGHGFEPSAAHVEHMHGFGPQERTAFRHRRISRVGRLLGHGRKPVKRAIPRTINRPVRRRRVLLGLGTGAVVAGGSAARPPSSPARSDPPAGGDVDPNTVTEGLGAAGLGDSPAEAARHRRGGDADLADAAGPRSRAAPAAPGHVRPDACSTSSRSSRSASTPGSSASSARRRSPTRPATRSSPCIRRSA